MVGLVGLDFLAASGAAVLVKAGVRITETKLSLKVPVLVKQPCVAVADASADKPALEACVPELAEVCAEQLEVCVYSSDVELSAMEVCSDKMVSRTVTEPISCARLHRPVLPPAVMAESPSVKAHGDVEGPFRGESHFHADIDIEDGVVQQVGLHSDILRISS